MYGPTAVPVAYVDICYKGGIFNGAMANGACYLVAQLCLTLLQRYGL